MPRNLLLVFITVLLLTGLFTFVLGFGPVFDWFTLYISAAGPNPYADSWYMLAKFFYAPIIAVAIIWVWQNAIARIRYRREVR